MISNQQQVSLRVRVRLVVDVLFVLFGLILVCIVERTASFSTITTRPPAYCLALVCQRHLHRQGVVIVNKNKNNCLSESITVGRTRTRSRSSTSDHPRHAYASRTTLSSYSSALNMNHNDGDISIVVAMTREAGKNAKLEKAILEQQQQSSSLSSSLCSSGIITLQPVEIPCIAHANGPDYPQVLLETLQNKHWDYVAVTSPEAARVLASVWKDCYDFVAIGDDENNNNNKDDTIITKATPPSVAAVGKATEAALANAGIAVAFCPSKATAATLVEELPMRPERTTPTKGDEDDNDNNNDNNDDPNSAQQQQPSVLYPASAKAQTTLQDGLRQRGFAVTRLNTYDTVTAVWNDKERDMAHQARIVCFASPSAVKGWIQNYNNNNKGNNAVTQQVLAACIGETSAEACRKQGWSEENIFFPDKPGIEGWVEAIHQAAQRLVPVS